LSILVLLRGPIV